YGSLVSGLLRTMALRRHRPAELLKALNDVLLERKVEARYVTLCVLLWHPATRQIVMANAGALPPMISRRSEILKVRVEGVPLGLLAAREYEESAFQAEPGDTIVLYSDGITDHLNPAGREFGRGRLAEAVRAGQDLSAEDLVSNILQALDAWSTDAFDDQTVF